MEPQNPNPAPQPTMPIMPSPIPALEPKPTAHKVWKIVGIVLGVIIVIFFLLVWWGSNLNKQALKNNSTKTQGDAAASPTQGTNMSNQNQNQNDPDSMDNYLNMQTDSGEYKDFADKLVTQLAAGNTQYLKDNFSPSAVAANPPGAIDNILLPDVKTFFTNFDHVGKTVTIAPSSDGYGNTGYSFAMTAVYKDASEKPFKVYVVKENGKLVVGNFIVTK